MGKMMRFIKRLRIKPPKPRPWAGEPSELELELKIHDIEARYEGVAFHDLPKAVQNEYGRLHSLLLAESQRRSGLTLIKITQNAEGDGATYDARNFHRLVKNTQAWIEAGMEPERAIARAIDDERWRQQNAA